MKRTHKPVHVVHIDRTEPELRRWDAKQRAMVTEVGAHRLQATLQLFVDWDELIKQLGNKALHSRGGKSRALRGAVEVRARGIIRNAIDKRHEYLSQQADNERAAQLNEED